MPIELHTNTKRRDANLVISHYDAHVLRQLGLNPDDFRDAFEGRRTSVLFTPFRHPKR